jgi:hypothetical protein
MKNFMAAPIQLAVHSDPESGFVKGADPGGQGAVEAMPAEWVGAG